MMSIQGEISTRFSGTTNNILYFKLILPEQSTGSEELFFVIVGKTNTVTVKCQKKTLPLFTALYLYQL